MTNRRPDIHCTGCGTYCYSLSHRPEEQVFPVVHYCENCTAAIGRGVRTSAMLNHAWYGMCGAMQLPFQKIRELAPAELSLIRSFSWTEKFSRLRRERKFEKDPNKMTAREWKEIAEKKLRHFAQYCGPREIAFLNSFIQSAR